MAKDYDSLISQKQNEVQNLSNQLEGIKEQFATASIPFVRNWLSENIERFVIQESETTIQLGKDKVRELKKEATALIENAEDIIRRNLEKHADWLPKPKKDHSSYGYYDEKKAIQESLGRAVRYSIGSVATLLSKYHYSVEHYEQDYSGNERIWRYKYGFDWSSEMQEAHKTYQNTYEKLQDAQKENEGSPEQAPGYQNPSSDGSNRFNCW